MTTPNPTMLAAIAQRRQAALLDETAKAKIVRPGRASREINVISDGVFKTKHLEPGMKVRPFVKGEPRGSERTIKSAKRLGNGAEWHIEFESAHPAANYKAAYRWYCQMMDGATITRTVSEPALVAYEEA
jgi:hypothetical protein